MKRSDHFLSNLRSLMILLHLNASCCAALFVILLIALAAVAQETRPRRTTTAANPADSPERQARDRQIAIQFAPVLYQGLGSHPRSDYVTNFDYDGDWKGDNNWKNVDNKRYPLRAYVYFSVSETSTHYFVHYAFFHPRDYKGGLVKSTLLETLLREGIKHAGGDPTGGLADDVALSHENDLEGCLVVAEKSGEDPAGATVQFVETLAHNRYLKYRPAGAGETIQMKGQRPLLFIEPKGHGVYAYTGDGAQLKDSINGTLVYSYTGQAEDPDATDSRSVGYDLIPIYTTLWKNAQSGENDTYGESLDYKVFSVLIRNLKGEDSTVERQIGTLGSAFRGSVGFKNKARPPWAWFDQMEKDRPRGEWFFDPAAVIARHFNLGKSFSSAYIYNPYLNVSSY